MKILKVFKKLFFVALVATISCCATGCDNSNSNNPISGQGSIFRIAKSWERTGFIYHYNSGTVTGPLPWLSCEGLVQYVRTTDELHYLLAESIEHNDDSTTIINIRKGVKWHDGSTFTAQDVVAYYNINFTTVTNFLSKPIELIDEYTVKLTWKTWLEPEDDVKTLMIAMDKVGTVQYSIFKQYVDRAQEILATQTDCEEGYLGWAPYGKMNDAASDTAYNENYKSFCNVNPEIFVATGPYKLAQLTQTQMILVKNEDYYFADKIPYDTVICYNTTDLSTIYNMLLKGELDYQDGFAPDTMIEQITTENQSMVHLKAYDPASVGVLFNLEKDIWSDNVRLAFQYIFDREEMKNSANRYAITTYYPAFGIAPTEAQKYMSEEDFAGIPQYSHDEAKAAQLLEEEGWQKINGKWCDEYGDPIKLTLGYDGANAIMSGLAEAVQGALKAFGIDCALKRAADWGTWYSLASAEDSYYDFTINWTEVSSSIGHPAGSYKYFFSGNNGPVMHVPTLSQADLAAYGIPGYEIGNVNLRLDKHDGSGKFHVYQYLTEMFSMDDDELSVAVTDLVYGIGNLNYGISFFQNVSGGFYNSAVIGNLPMEEIWSTGTRNVTTIPEMYSEDYFALAGVSLEFAHASALLFRYTDAALQ